MRSALYKNKFKRLHFNGETQKACNLLPLWSIEPFGPLMPNKMSRMVDPLYFGANLVNFVEELFLCNNRFYSIKIDGS